MTHNYERTAASSVPTMWSVLENWVNHFMAQVVNQIPSNLHTAIPTPRVK